MVYDCKFIIHVYIATFEASLQKFILDHKTPEGREGIMGMKIKLSGIG